MTTTTPALRVPTAPGRALALAAAAATAHMLLLVPAYAADEEPAVGLWFAMAALGAVLTWPVFARVVPGGGARTALALGVAAALSVGLYWAALTIPLAIATALVAASARRRGEAPVLVALAVLAAGAGLVGIGVVAVVSAG